eukprot:scaffold8363_cov163-Amphora_coffeaeformis.AAC.3
MDLREDVVLSPWQRRAMLIHFASGHFHECVLHDDAMDMAAENFFVTSAALGFLLGSWSSSLSSLSKKKDKKSPRQLSRVGRLMTPLAQLAWNLKNHVARGRFLGNKYVLPRQGPLPFAMLDIRPSFDPLRSFTVTTSFLRYQQRQEGVEFYREKWGGICND